MRWGRRDCTNHIDPLKMWVQCIKGPILSIPVPNTTICRKSITQCILIFTTWLKASSVQAFSLSSSWQTSKNHSRGYIADIFLCMLLVLNFLLYGAEGAFCMHARGEERARLRLFTCIIYMSEESIRVNLTWIKHEIINKRSWDMIYRGFMSTFDNPDTQMMQFN